jgi:hypothetical protein
VKFYICKHKEGHQHQQRIGLLASDQALKSPPTNERHECINEEEEDVIDDTLEDEEEEMGRTMTLNQNELHDLI